MNIDSATTANITRPAAEEAKATRPAASATDGSAKSAEKSTAADATTQVELSRTAKLMAKNDSGTIANTLDTLQSKLPVKETQSFVYGALGLDRPDEAPKNENTFYTAGKWLSAAATAGMLVSLLV